jgi:hypothetical protein
MRRQEAVSVVKEIGVSCKLLNPKEIDLESSSTGHYEIHIKSSVDGENWQHLKAMAKKYCLGIKLTDQTLIIYKPESKKNDKFFQV